MSDWIGNFHRLVARANEALALAQLPHVLHLSLTPGTSLGTDQEPTLVVWASLRLLSNPRPGYFFYGSSIQISGGTFDDVLQDLESIIGEPSRIAGMMESAAEEAEKAFSSNPSLQAFIPAERKTP
jgi:hypothetical protein